MVEKEYNIRLTANFIGTAVGDNRQEAIEDLDLLDFIDEATHSGNFQVVEINSKLGMKDVLPTVKRYFQSA
jgi:hypothetical protein